MTVELTGKEMVMLLEGMTTLMLHHTNVMAGNVPQHVKEMHQRELVSNRILAAGLAKIAQQSGLKLPEEAVVAEDIRKYLAAKA